MHKYSTPRFSRVCIVDTVYSLFIYLLISSKEETDHTFFFFSDGIDASIRNRFPNHYYIPSKDFPKRNFISRLWLRLKLRLVAPFKWPFLSSADLYGHDHLCFTPSLTGNRKMTVLEDGMGNYCDNPFGFVEYSGIELLIRNLLFGPLSTKRPLGKSSYAEKVILTGMKSIPEELKQKAILIDLPQMWDALEESEKGRICCLFSIDFAMLKELSQKDTVLFTQPFADEITLDELVGIYRKMLENVDKDKLLIKRHPRDMVDYKTAFPGVCVFDKPIPMELLTLLGVRFKDAYTISSTAVLLLPPTVKIHFSGHAVHPGLLEKYGDIQIGNLKGNK